MTHQKAFCRIILLPFLLHTTFISGQFTPTKHRPVDKSVVAISGPGSYSDPGTTYMLVNDITSPRSAIFLGKDITLDLNGYTIKYADGKYEHIANSGFEEGAKGWDLSKAPGAKVVSTEDVPI